jgi:hypothetical protein
MYGSTDQLVNTGSPGATPPRSPAPAAKANPEVAPTATGTARQTTLLALARHGDGAGASCSLGFPIPELLPPGEQAPWEVASTHATVPELLSAVYALFGTSYADRMQQMDRELTTRRDESVKLFNKEQADLARVQHKQTEMEPGQIATIVVSALALLVSIALPFLGPAAVGAIAGAGAAAAAAGASGITTAATVVGTLSSATFLGMNIADQAIKHDPNHPTRLNEKCEQVPLEGMNFGVIVDMIFDLAVRDGTLVIDGEDNGAKEKPGALHMSRDTFDKAKKDWGAAVNWTMIVLPIALGIGAFFQGGVVATLKSLGEKISATLSETASSMKALPATIAEFCLNKPLDRIVSDIGESLGSLRTLGNAKSAAETVSKITSISQGGIAVQQGVMAKELADLQAALSHDRRDLEGTRGDINIIESAMPLLSSAYKETLDAQLALVRAVVSIVRDMNASSINAARNASAKLHVPSAD